MPEMREITASAQLHIADDVDVMISPTDIEYDTSRYDESAELTLKGLTDVAADFADMWPEESTDPVGLTVEVNGTLIASGTLESGHTNGEGLWTGEAYDAVRDLSSTTTSAEYRGEDIVTIVEDIFDEVGIPADDEADEESGAPPGTPTYVIEPPGNYDEAIAGEAGPQLLTAYRVSTPFHSKPTPEALTAVLDKVGWRWWTDASNTIHVSNTFDSEEFQPKYILETSAGIQSPPYQSVEITAARQPLGAAPGGTQGPYREQLIGKGDPIKVRAPEGGGTPVFRHTDRSIETTERAERVAQQVWEEMLTQRRSGSITMLGNPEIRPLDGVRVPESMGGELYIVSSLTTKVNGSDGFIQEIDVGGLLDAGDGELADPPDTVIEPIGDSGDDVIGDETDREGSLVDPNPASDDT